MKLLVVDVGNTSTAVGLWDRGRVSHVVHMDGKERIGGLKVEELKGLRVEEAVSKPPLHVDAFVSNASDKDGFLHFDAIETIASTGFETASEGLKGLDGVAYVSVVPKADRAYLAAFRKLGLTVHRVSHRDFRQVTRDARREDAASAERTFNLQPSTFNLSLSYPRPETIGADRLADAAGAVSRYGAPVLVMDFGTALTAAVVTEDRVWRGGVIAPGFPLMRDYLFERTAKLPRMELGKGRTPKIGRSTEEAMRFGALVGYRGMVREIVAELKKNFKTDFKLVATGGFARWALRNLDLPFTVDPTLTLYGAGLLAAQKL